MNLINAANEVGAYLKTNPTLVAVLAAAGAYATRSAYGIYSNVRKWIVEQLSSNLQVVEQYGNDIPKISAMLNRYRLGSFSRNYSLNESRLAPSSDSGKRQLSTGYGSGIALWHGTLIFYVKSFSTETWGIVETITMNFLTRDRSKVQGFFDEAFYVDKTVPFEKVEVFDYFDGWNATIERRLRNPATVFYNDGLLETLFAKLDWFLANEDWYVSRGVNYKLVIALHGVPGGGKTSLIQAMACHMKRNIYSLRNVYSIERATALLPEDGILAIEDIDTMGDFDRDRAEKEANAIKAPVPGVIKVDMGSDVSGLNSMLNVFDGMRTPHGMVAVISTNKIEQFDAALIRPCRIDLMVEIKPLEFGAMARMFAAYYPHTDVRTLNVLNEATWIPQTGAQLQELFMTNPDANAAVRALSALCHSRPQVVAAE